MRPIHRRNITGEVKDRIVTIALRFPHRAPRRLALLLQRDRIYVTTASIRCLLRKEDLRSSVTRIEKVKTLAATDALARSDESIMTENSDQTAETQLIEKPKVVWLTPKKRRRALFSLRSLGKQMAHVALVVLAASTGFYMANYHHRSMKRVREIALQRPAAQESLTLTGTKQNHLIPYNIVYPAYPIEVKDMTNNRTFDVDVKDAAPQSRKRLMVEGGLKLIGTLVADTPDKSVAVIEYLKTRAQESFKEGDQLGNLRIKRILRNQIFINNGDGELRLALMHSLPATSNGIPAPDAIAIAQVTKENPLENLRDAYFYDRELSEEKKTSGGRRRVQQLDRKAVELELADVESVLKRVEIQPVASHGHPAGFRIAPIEAGSIFADLGLRSTDVIVGVNGASITTPD